MRRVDPTYRHVRLFGSLTLSERCNARFAALLEECVAVLADFEVASVEHGWVRNVFTHLALPLKSGCTWRRLRGPRGSSQSLPYLPPNMQRRGEALRRTPRAQPPTRCSLRLREERKVGKDVRRDGVEIPLHGCGRAPNGPVVARLGGEAHRARSRCFIGMRAPLRQRAAKYKKPEEIAVTLKSCNRVFFSTSNLTSALI